MLFRVLCRTLLFFFFFFNDTATTEIYTLSLHDALPICNWRNSPGPANWKAGSRRRPDRKSTRLNSSHGYISYAVFCLKKKNKKSGATRGRDKTRGVETGIQHSSTT